MTQVELLGRYRPPFGRFGALADSVAGHDGAVCTVAKLLGRLESEE